jgi:hypothetical protein
LSLIALEVLTIDIFKLFYSSLAIVPKMNNWFRPIIIALKQAEIILVLEPKEEKYSTRAQRGCIQIKSDIFQISAPGISSKARTLSLGFRIILTFPNKTCKLNVGLREY